MEIKWIIRLCCCIPDKPRVVRQQLNYKQSLYQNPPFVMIFNNKERRNTC